MAWTSIRRRRRSGTGGATITVTTTFTPIPGVGVSYGHAGWDSFPRCGCDACGEDPDEEAARLADVVRDVVAGGFTETRVRRRWRADTYDSWLEARAAGVPARVGPSTRNPSARPYLSAPPGGRPGPRDRARAVGAEVTRTNRDDRHWAEIVAAIEPQGRLARTWDRAGGLSATMMVLEIEVPGGGLQRLVVRRARRPDQERSSLSIVDEHHLISRVQAFGVPVPRPRLVDPSARILPDPYAVYDYVDGTPRLKSAAPEQTGVAFADRSLAQPVLHPVRSAATMGGD